MPDSARGLSTHQLHTRVAGARHQPGDQRGEEMNIRTMSAASPEVYSPVTVCAWHGG